MTVQPAPDFTDHTYATRQGVDLELRVWASSASPSSPTGTRPWLLWVHGGGFFLGSHYIPPSWLLPAFRERYHIVSAAYRLAPQADIPTQVQDIKDAFAWCRHNLSMIDQDNYAVGGDSAGATIATIAAMTLEPAPKAVIDIYGLTDFTVSRFWPSDEVKAANLADPQYTYSGRYTEAELAAAFVDYDLANAIAVCPSTSEFKELSEKEIGERWSRPDFRFTDRVRLQTEMRDYHFKHSLHHKIYLRDRDPKELSFVYLLDGVKTYPPTVILHGTADWYPVEMSYNTAKKLKGLGADTLELYKPDAEHAWRIEGPEVADWKAYIVPMVEFVDKYLA